MEKLILKDRTIWIGDSEVAFGDTIEDAEPILEDKTLAKGETFIRLGKYEFFEKPFQVTVSAWKTERTHSYPQLRRIL